MGFLYNDGYKPEAAPPLQSYPVYSRQAPLPTAQTPILAPTTTQLPMAPASLTPLQHHYDTVQTHAPTMAPTPLQSVGSFNSLATQTPLAPSTGLGPSSYVADHQLLGSFQQMPYTHADAATPAPASMPGMPSIHNVPSLSGVSGARNVPSQTDMQSHHGNAAAINNLGSAGPGPAGLGSIPAPSSIPGLNSFRHSTFRRPMQDPSSDPAHLGHFPYNSLQAPALPPYPQMTYALNTAMQNYPAEPALQHGGFNIQLGPIHAPDRSSFLPSVPNTYYTLQSQTQPQMQPQAQPQMQPQLQQQMQPQIHQHMQPQLQPIRYPAEDRSFNENPKLSDELHLSALRTRPEQAPASNYPIGQIQPAQTQTVNKTVPSFPALFSQRNSMKRTLSVPVNGNANFRPAHLRHLSTAGLYTQSNNDSGGVLDERVNFKPTETKQNKRPKINKLANDLTAFKRAPHKKRKVKAEEYSFDETYANFQQILGITVSRADIKERYKLVLKSPLERYLFDFFVHKIAVFIDTFLVHEFFQIIVSELALFDETRMILDSMLCLSSLISQRKDPLSVDALCPYDYYQKCVYSVGKNVALDKAQDPDGKILARCLISTNLLCIYEMFFVAVDSVYVKGAGGILATIMARTDKSGGILQQSPFHYTCFWATVVCDLILSLKLECPCTFSIEKMWRSLDPGYDEYDSYEAFLHEKTSIKDAVEDCSSFVVTNEKTTWWLHKVTFLFILVNDFYNQYDVITQEDFMTNKRFHRWLVLKEKIEEFERRMPIYLKPLIFIPAAEEKDFPKIFFKDEKTVVTAINFRLAKLLLHAALEEKLQVLDVGLTLKERASYPHKYSENLAREVAGIMKTYDADMRIWPINIHSLRQASRFIEPSSPCFETLKNLTARVISVCQTRLNILDLMEDKAENSRPASLHSFVEA